MIWSSGLSRSTQLQCARLYMQPPQRRDYKAWVQMRERSRDHLQPFEPLWAPEAHTRAMWRLRLGAWCRSWRAGRGYAFFIWQVETNALLGGITLSNVRRGAVQTASVGYWLDVNATGRGFMREAVIRIIAFARDELALARLEASTLPENTRSRRLLVDCGFAEEGEAKAYLQIAGDRRDHVLYGLNLQAPFRP